MSEEPTRHVALVTGASSGIGDAFARQLAARGHDLVAVARDVDRLERLAAELAEAHGTRTEVMGADLTAAADLARIEARVADPAQPIDLLVNNAGFGTYGRMWEIDVDDETREVALNVIAPTRLTHAALGGMVERGRGGVINVASIAAYQPNPSMATYGATKAYIVNFTQAVHEELRGTGAKAMVLCPGFTRTEFQSRAGISESAVPKLLWQSAEACVAAALRDYDRGRAVCLPSAINTAGTAMLRITPSVISRKIAARVMARGNS